MEERRTEMEGHFTRIHADGAFLVEHYAEFSVRYAGFSIAVINQEVVATGRTPEELIEALKKQDLYRPGDPSLYPVGRYYFSDEAEERAATERADSLIFSPIRISG